MRPNYLSVLLLCFSLALVSSVSAQQTQIQYLSGTDKDHTSNWVFSVSSGNNAGIVSTIPVPSCWPSMGFGTFSYTQNTGSGMTSSNAETGFYTNIFAVPSGWAGKKIFLVFEGAFTDTSASINGQSVGPTHQGGYYEFRYDVTPYVVVGATTNKLAVTVRKFSANGSVEKAEEGNVDYWIFGGIYRPVYLEAKPSAYIDYVAANPLANGNITNNVFLGGITTNYMVQAFVTDTNNVRLGSVFSNSISAGATNVVLSSSLPTPNTWSSETPTLYTLTVQLVDTNGVVVHSVTNQIGFRTITFVANQGFFVNGKKVIMRGVCHHEEWPTTGRTSSYAQSSNDVAMIKDANFNAVRESHYPEDKTFLAECNRQGLYVLEEMNSYQFQIDLADGIIHVYEMIRRDVNDPCIIAWDNGNETAWNGSLGDLDGGNAGSTNYYGLYDVQNRLVIHPGANGGVFMNLLDYHYPSYNTFTSNLGAGKTAFSCTEILHALYDGGGGMSLQEYWDAERTAPNGVGMFVWSWDDEGVVRPDQGGIMDVRGQSAPDGIVGPYREKEASYFTYKSVYSPVQIGAPNPGSFTGSLDVTNRFDFTDLNQCQFKWQLGWYFDATDPTNNFSTNALTGGLLIGTNSGSFSGPSLPSGTSGIGTAGILNLPSFPGGWTNYDALRLTATDAYGYNIYTWTWPLRTQAQIRDRILGKISLGAPVITAITNLTEIIVTNGARIFHFSKTTGIINSLTVSNQSVSFTNGPRPVAGSAWIISGITNYSDGTNYIIIANDITSAANGFQWTLRPDGWLKLSYRYTLTGAQENIGVTFDYPTNLVTAMNWLGQGPYRVWKNRPAGQEIFTHAKAFNYTWTGQSTNYGASSSKPTTQWAYPEFGGFHGQLFWAMLATTQQPITIVTPTTNLFLRVLTPPTTDKSQVNPTFPPGNISLLQGISAIGDKFETAISTGPAGQTNVAAGLYTAEASFFFGALPASSADRDSNGLKDSWELKYFSALGQNPLSRANPDGLPLMVENAFDLSPTNNNLNSPRLPHFANGTSSPAALVYTVPASQSDFFNYTPQISADLLNWTGNDQNPAYFSITTVPSGADTIYMVQPVPAAWPGDSSHLFLRLQITAKP
jgi:Glycosyl hydrolases family 2, TIM barrel domain/Glycosyl hydrolases family 2, sugar binding domain/Glycosyl hydrolases family 2